MVAVARGCDAATPEHGFGGPKLGRPFGLPDAAAARAVPPAEAFAESLFDNTAEQLPAHFVMRPGAAVPAMVDQHA